jgi:DNA-binding transcriptional MerR regulator
MVGVTPNVLRAWERRYDLLSPSRQSGKQRLYSDQDVRLLRRIVDMTRSGLSIGEVVTLGRENLLGGSPVGEALPRREATQRTFAIPDDIREVMRGLAGDLAAPLSQRYAGESLDVSVRDLALSDLATLHRVYQSVKGLYELWTYMEHRTVAEIVGRRLQSLGDPQLRSQVHQLGADTHPRDPLLQAGLWDARDGALALLLEGAQGLDFQRCRPERLDLLISLARDHAKVLRNVFSDLDPALREADEHPKAHQVVPILSKIDHLREGGWIAAVGSEFAGFITCRCLETSTLDRVIYRYLAHFRDADQAHPPNLWVGEVANGWVRWVWEATAAPGRSLDIGPFVALVVGLAAGVDAKSALEAGYLGGRRSEGRDWLWFHWPRFDPPPEVARCTCHPLS